MLTSRPQTLVRLLTLMVAATFVLGTPVIAAAKAPATATESARSTSTLKKNHVRGGAAEGRGGLNERVQKLTERLKLTEDQAAKVKTIMQERMTRAAEMRAKYKGESATPETRATFEKAHKDLHADTDAKMAEVLTADQMTEYRKITAERMRKMGAKEEKEEAKEGTK